MRINDLEARSGLDRATIRYYEKETLITPKRSENNYRDYSEEDLLNLRKIKLLRQTGMSLEKIKMIKSGTDNLSSALAEQIHELDKEIHRNIQARTVCSRIAGSAVTYDTLDPEGYLALFEAPLVKAPTMASSSGPHPFKENVPIEYHPIRRFIARRLDYFGLTVLIYVLVFAILRLRRFGWIASISSFSLIYWSSVFLWVPMEAVWLRFTCTPPGKWLMGIRVESEYGGKLYFSDAMLRSWRVLANGMGFNIPVIGLLCEVKGFENAKNGVQSSWNDRSEMFFSWHRSKNVSKTIAFVIILLCITAYTAMDILLPLHRGGDLTLEEFAENYNGYVYTVGQGHNFDLMDENGEWRIVKGTVFSNGMGEIARDHKPKRFEYIVLDDGRVERIEYFNYLRYIDGYTGHRLPDECACAIYAMTGGQRSVGPFGFDTVLEQVQAIRLLDGSTGVINFQDVQVSWRSWVEPFEVVDKNHPVETIERLCIEVIISVK